MKHHRRQCRGNHVDPTLVAPSTGPSPEELKLARRASRQVGLFAPHLLKAAFWQSFVMLRPDIQWKNPVMFVVEVGTVLTHHVTPSPGSSATGSAGRVGYLLRPGHLAVADACCSPISPRPLAEARGKAQADALRKTRRETPGHRLRTTRSSSGRRRLRLETGRPPTCQRDGDIVVVEAGQVIPGDGEIIEGVASVDESAITGESAPVIREAGGDRSGVTGGTRVLSDRIVVRRSRPRPGKSFLDRMIALVEGAIRQRTPNEIALSLVLAAFTLIFLIVTVALWPMARNAEQYMKAYLGVDRAGQEPGHRRADAGGPAGLPDSDDDRRPAGRHRHRRHGPGPAGQHHRQERQGGRSGRRRRHAAAGQDRHHHDRQPPGDAVRAGRRLHRRRAGPAGGAGLDRRPDARRARASSICISKLERPRQDGRAGAASGPAACSSLPEVAVHRIHGPDAHERRRSARRPADSQGAPGRDHRATSQHEQRHDPGESATSRWTPSPRKGATPLLVCEGNRIAGMVVLEDILKPGMRDRFERLRQMGLRTVMVTGDNPLTAKAIAEQAGVDDYIAQATPEAKLAYIRKEQAGGKLVAMMGDGTNDAPALAQADVGVAMNSGTQAAKEAGNMVDLDSDPTKLIEVVEIGKQLLMTRGALDDVFDRQRPGQVFRHRAGPVRRHAALAEERSTSCTCTRPRRRSCRR